MQPKRKTFIGCVVGAVGLVLVFVATVPYWSVHSVDPVQHAVYVTVPAS